MTDLQLQIEDWPDNQTAFVEFEGNPDPDAAQPIRFRVLAIAGDQAMTVEIGWSDAIGLHAVVSGFVDEASSVLDEIHLSTGKIIFLPTQPEH